MPSVPPPLPNTPTGYLSEEAKRKFTLTAGILGGCFLVLQFLAPMAIMLVAMPTAMFCGMWSRDICEPGRSAVWNDRLWFVVGNTGFGQTGASAKLALKSLPFDNTAHGLREEVADLSYEDVWLLAGRDRLWLISCDSLGFLKDGVLTRLGPYGRLGDICRPFLHDGAPTVIEDRPDGIRLLAFRNDAWEPLASFTLPNGGSGSGGRVATLEAVSAGGRLHLFMNYGDSVYWHAGIPTEREGWSAWMPIAKFWRSWSSTVLDGQPALFGMLGDEMHGQIAGYVWREGEWRELFRKNVGLTTDLAVHPLSEPRQFIILTHGFPGSVRVRRVADGQVVHEAKHGSGFPFSRSFMLLMFIPHIVMMLMPLILALVLAGPMRRWRVCEHRAPTMTVPYASLPRRAVAQIIDAAVLGGPIAAGWLLMMKPFLDPEHMFEPGRVLAAGGLTALGVVWGIGGLLVYSALEGRSGRTPGKWAAGIIVLGTDLRPCGFGRALVRNLLKFVDGFFNFMVGVLLVSLSENWQRIGDMAARTVVLRCRAEPTGASVAR